MNWWVLRRQPHISWLIAAMCLALLIGVWAAQYAQPGLFGSGVWYVVGGVLVGLSLRCRYVWLIPLLLLGGVLIGMCRGSIEANDLRGVQGLIGKQVTVTGIVREDVDTGSGGLLIVRLSQLDVHGRPLAGALWASVAFKGEIRRSDHLTISGTLDAGFGSFVAAMYRGSVQKVARSQPGDVALEVRDGFADQIRRAIPEPAASLGIGYLVGQKRALPADLALALQITGLTHVVVASGYNLTILVRLARRLFVRVSKYAAALAASSMIIGFIAVTGLSPSMSRAGLVAGLSLAAWYYGRRFHPLVLLSVAAAVTVMVHPSFAWGDVGWQLSFTAFAGVMILAPLLQRYFFGDAKPGMIRQIIGETCAAVIVTAPLLISAFGQFSNVAIFANLLVLPLVPLAMLLTFVAGIGALLVPAWAIVIGTPAAWLLGYMVQVSEFMAGLPWAVTQVQLGPLVVALCYVGLIALCLYLWRTTGYDLRQSNLVE